MNLPANIPSAINGRGRTGFTLVALVVVIAILGVLAAVSVPIVTGFLARSKEQAYNIERERIQRAVDAYRSSPTNDRFLGRRQYPTHGASKIGGEFVRPDENLTGEVLLLTGNLLGGTEGGHPRWADNGNGIREAPDEEVLIDEVLVEGDANTVPGWHVSQVVRQEVAYIVDSKDYFTNFDKLVAQGLLENTPSSASPDNQPPGSARVLSWPYSWFVNKQGIVESLLYFFPVGSNAGFQEVFPSQRQQASSGEPGDSQPPDGQPPGGQPPAPPVPGSDYGITGAIRVSEGSEYTLILSFSAVRPTQTSWEIDWGDAGGTETIDGSPRTVTNVYTDGDSFHTALASAIDGTGSFAANPLSVTVSNVAPSINLVGASDVDLGTPYSLTLGNVTDPGADTVVQYIVNWGDGSTQVFASQGTIDHTYSGDPATVTISVDLIDEDNGGAPHTGAGTLTVALDSGTPTVALGGPSSIDEEADYSLTLGPVPGFNTVSQYVVKWG